VKKYLSKDESISMIRTHLSRCVPAGLLKRTVVAAGVHPSRVDDYIEIARGDIALASGESILPGIRSGLADTIALIDEQIEVARVRGDDRQIARLVSTRRACLGDLLRWQQVQHLTGLVDDAAMDPRDAAALLSRAWGGSE
jgi:hypothetical protein